MSTDLLFEFPSQSVEDVLQNGKRGSTYRIVDGRILGRSPSIWFTNLDHNKRHEFMDLVCRYSPEEYPHYDNYDAIEVNKTADIPCNYPGVMGVPITFLDKYNPEQFEILGITDRGNEWGLKKKDYTIDDNPKFADLNRRGAILLGGSLVSTYARILIRNKHPQQI